MTFVYVSQELRQIIQTSNDFGTDMLNKINATENGNNIISPLSLSTALGMIHLGAKGQTNNELRQLLGYNKYDISDRKAHYALKDLFEGMFRENKRHYVLNVANRVMVHNELQIKAKYQTLLQAMYKAGIEKVDFIKNYQNAIITINNWIANKTNDKVGFEEQLPPYTRFVIVNAVYFKGKWLHKFDYKETKEGAFNNNGNTKTTVQMMFRSNTSYNFIYSQELDAFILELPYSGGDISMYIVLPRESSGLQKTASVLTEEKLNSAIKSMKTFCINLYLPKFKIEGSYNLVDAFASLGVPNICNDSADLSEISYDRLNVSEVVHKVYLEVNEDGGEATPVMVAECSETSQQPNNFRIDHPFICVIRNKIYNQNLLYGHISQPKFQ